MHFMPDDALFYLQIARNIAAGNGSTFNGVMETNGYHPLWMVCCAAVYGVFGHWPSLAIRVVVLIQQALSVGAVFFLFRTLRPLAGKWALLGAAGFGLYLFTGMFGSEAHINAFFCALSLWLVTERPVGARSRSGLFWIGLVCGLCVLARLDNLFYVAGLGLYAAWSEWNFPRRISRLFIIAAAAALPVALYVASNALYFDCWMPVSGAIKSSFPILHWNTHQLNLLGRIVAFVAVAGLTVPLWKCSASWIAFASTGVLLHALYLVCFSRGVVNWSWYFVPGVLLVSSVFSLLAATGSSRFLRSYSAAFCKATVSIVIALTVSRAWIKAYNQNAIAPDNPLLIQPKLAEYSWYAQMAVFLRDTLPAGSRIFVWDLPGIMAFLTDPAVVPRDGLVGNYGFSHRLLESGIENFLREEKLQFWVGPMVEDGQCLEEKGAWKISRSNGVCEIEVFAPLYPEQSAGLFRVYDKDIVTDLRRVISHSDTPAIGVWKLSSGRNTGPGSVP
jgi:hypothetical protein